MFNAKLGEIGPSIQKKILKFCQCIFANSNYLSLEKVMTLHLNKLESSSPKDALCQDWLKFAKRFWRRRFLNVYALFTISIHFPLQKSVALHLKTLASSPPKDALCQV